MSPNRLFDASSVVDVVLGTTSTDVEIGVLFDECILDLTIYEAANAVWKIGVAHDRLTATDLDAAVELLTRLLDEFELESATAASLVNTMTLARDNGLTFYDAAYLATAQRRNLTLVTEDGPLRDAADGQGVSTAQVRTLE